MIDQYLHTLKITKKEELKKMLNKYKLLKYEYLYNADIIDSLYLNKQALLTKMFHKPLILDQELKLENKQFNKEIFEYLELETMKVNKVKTEKKSSKSKKYPNLKKPIEYTRLDLITFLKAGIENIQQTEVLQEEDERILVQKEPVKEYYENVKTMREAFNLNLQKAIDSIIKDTKHHKARVKSKAKLNLNAFTLDKEIFTTVNGALIVNDTRFLKLEKEIKNLEKKMHLQ